MNTGAIIVGFSPGLSSHHLPGTKTAWPLPVRRDRSSSRLLNTHVEGTLEGDALPHAEETTEGNAPTRQELRREKAVLTP